MRIRVLFSHVSWKCFIDCSTFPTYTKICYVETNKYFSSFVVWMFISLSLPLSISLSSFSLHEGKISQCQPLSVWAKFLPEKNEKTLITFVPKNSGLLAVWKISWDRNNEGSKTKQVLRSTILSSTILLVFFDNSRIGRF